MKVEIPSEGDELLSSYIVNMDAPASPDPSHAGRGGGRGSGAGDRDAGGRGTQRHRVY